MTPTQPALSDQLVGSPTDAFTSVEHNGTRLILIDGRLIFSLQTSDELSCRHAAVQLYLCWKISQWDIAAAWSVTVRTVNSWVKKYRAGGVDALKKKAAGAPVKVTMEIQGKVISLRQDNWKVPQICQHLSLSKSAVYRILETMKSPQDELPGVGKNTGADDDACQMIELLDEGNEQNQDRVRSCDGADPLDRSVDRFYARLGMIDNAEPLFAESDHVEYAGAFLGVAMLSASNFFDCIGRIYKTIGPAFYGLQNSFMCMFLMAILRIKNPEQLNESKPQKLGRILGLDRAPSVKTLRRKIKVLSARGQAVNLMSLLGKERMEEANLPDAVLYVDGHVQCYYGKKKLGKTFSTTKNRALKANTDYWVNLAGGTPLLCIPTEFNESLTQALPHIVLQARKLCKNKRITVVFDRAGASALTFETLMRMDCDFIAYRKNPQPIDDGSLFRKESTKINARTYGYAPYERRAEMPICEKNSKGTYRKTRRTIVVREVIILRSDHGQTHIVTSRKDLEGATVATILFHRWTQENFFKYLDQMYAFNHICVYKTEKVNSSFDHPNPEYVKLSKTIQSIRLRIGKLLGIAYDKLKDNHISLSVGQLSALLSKKKIKEFDDLKQAIKKARQAQQLTPERETATHYDHLEQESRLIANSVKMAAYHIEGKLARILTHYWNGINGNERGILSAFLKSTGSIKLSSKIIHITLEKQSTPERTLMLRRLCDDMTVVAAHYPKTQLRMVFDVQK